MAQLCILFIPPQQELFLSGKLKLLKIEIFLAVCIFFLKKGGNTHERYFSKENLARKYQALSLKLSNIYSLGVILQALFQVLCISVLKLNRILVLLLSLVLGSMN